MKTRKRKKVHTKEWFPIFLFPRLRENLQSMIFQHDGALPLSPKEGRRYLDSNFLDRWMGCGGPTSWPSSSPDLNLRD